MKKCLLALIFSLIFVTNSYGYANRPAVSESKDFQILIAETSFDDTSYNELVIIGLNDGLSVQDIKILNDTEQEIKYELARTQFPLQVDRGYGDWSVTYEIKGYSSVFQVILTDGNGEKHLFEFMYD